jgi:hypothetical protein
MEWRVAAAQRVALVTGAAALACVWTSNGAPAEPQPAQPALPSVTSLLAGEPMRITLVRAEGPACDPNCPMWIAADGKIVAGTAEKLRQVLQSAPGRRLPILINSPGGVVAEAMAMGRLIRRNGLSVAVARTHLAECRLAGKTCPDQRATTSLPAVCASACSLVLAAGVRRYVSDYAFVGVHELMTLHTVMHTLRHYEVFYRIVGGRKQEISRKLLSENTSTNSTVSEASDDVEHSLVDYFTEMGVGEPVLHLTLTTPSGSIRRLTGTELRDSRLATHVLKGPAPIRAAGLNGVEAIAIDNGATGDFLADGAAPLSLGEGKGAEVGLQLRYRPAGGNARLDLMVRDPITKEAVGAGTNGALLILAPQGPALAALPRTDRRLRMTFPVSQLCQLSEARAPTLTLFDDDAGAEGAWPPVPLDINALAGAKPLIGEACAPAPPARR